MLLRRVVNRNCSKGNCEREGTICEGDVDIVMQSVDVFI